MKLYVNGDSNCAEYGQAWTQKLQQHFDCGLVNQAASGGSNPRTLRTVADFLDQAQNDIRDYLIIIGWTSWEREEWLHQGQYWQVNASGLDHVPVELQDRYRDWVSASCLAHSQQRSEMLHEQIWHLHQRLQAMHVSHVFFNTLMPFQHQVKLDPGLQKDWTHNYIGPYQNELSYYWYLKQQGFSADNYNHYGSSAQLCWADFFIDYLEQHK